MQHAWWTKRKDTLYVGRGRPARHPRPRGPTESATRMTWWRRCAPTRRRGGAIVGHAATRAEEKAMLLAVEETHAVLRNGDRARF